MTEGNGHVIDPNGDARRTLHEAVAEHGPEALSNAVLMDNACRDHLSSLPGESILIGSAARTDVPALLRDLIPRLGNYGAIQSAAVTLAEEHELDIPACVWVVREFARALGHIAPRPATGGSGSWPGLGRRPVSGYAPRPAAGPSGTQGAGRRGSRRGRRRQRGGSRGTAQAPARQARLERSGERTRETAGSGTVGSGTAGSGTAGAERGGQRGAGQRGAGPAQALAPEARAPTAGPAQAQALKTAAPKAQPAQTAPPKPGTPKVAAPKVVSARAKPR